MQTQAILHANYLDIVFDNRNKLYGGYELRSRYQRRMTIAILIVVSVCFTMAVICSMKKRQHPAHTNPVVYKEIEMHHIEPPTIVKPVILPPPVEAMPKTNTAKLTPPVITPDDLVKPEDLPTAGKTDAVPGTGTHIGLPGDISGTIEAPKITTGIITPVTDTKPFTVVEQMPEFQGDMVAYLSKQLIYPPLARDNNIQGKVFIQFVVNEDGSVSNAKVIRGIGSGCDAEALRVVNNMPKWKPGKQNGKAVKVYYTLPIRFVLG